MTTENPIDIRNSITDDYFKDLNKKHDELLLNIKNNLPKLEELLEDISSHWHACDYFYRFYHHSFKVYYVQGDTKKIVEMLKSLAPEGITKLNPLFEQIYKEGTDKVFKIEHNKDWLLHTRGMIEAFLHAKYFLELVIKNGKELEKAPDCLNSDWAAVLYFYNIR